MRNIIKGALFYDANERTLISSNSKTVTKKNISAKTQSEQEKPWWKFW